MFVNVSYANKGLIYWSKHKNSNIEKKKKKKKKLYIYINNVNLK